MLNFTGSPLRQIFNGINRLSTKQSSELRSSDNSAVSHKFHSLEQIHHLLRFNKTTQCLLEWDSIISAASVVHSFHVRRAHFDPASGCREELSNAQVSHQIKRLPVTKWIWQIWQRIHILHICQGDCALCYLIRLGLNKNCSKRCVRKKKKKKKIKLNWCGRYWPNDWLCLNARYTMIKLCHLMSTKDKKNT